MKYKINEEGLNKLKAMGRAVKDSLAERVHDRAQELCPVEIGALRESGVAIHRKTLSYVRFGESNEAAKKAGRVLSYSFRPTSRWGKTKGQPRGPEFYALYVEIGSQGRKGVWFMTRALIEECSKPLPTDFSFPTQYSD
jgi:hypothetical protein